MMELNGKALRPWREIAADAAREKDAQRLTQLVEELQQALDEPYKKAEPHDA